MEELIKEYKESLAKVNKSRFTIADEHSKKLLGNCATSLRYSIDYMELGKEPGDRRSITNRSYEQRTVPRDPSDYNFIKQAVLQRKVNKRKLTEEQEKQLKDIMAILTKREREAFTMVRGNGYSFSQAGKLMKTAKGAVQTLVDRAERKMRFTVTKDKKRVE